MAFFPLMIDMKDKKVLIVGGGRIAAHKASLMETFEAKVTVMSKEFTGEFSKTVKLIKKTFEDGPMEKDVKRYDLVIAATDDTFLNSQIKKLCNRNKIFINVVDDALASDFIFPALIKDKDVVISVSSGGNSPALTQYVRDKIKDELPENLGVVNEILGSMRKEVKDGYKDPEIRKKIYRKKIEELLRDGK